MTKKVTAPKTHKPSGNRPLEHLAYLNRQEMDYLRGLNGGYMERGPRGLPSFAEETVGPGSSGNTSSGGKGPSGAGSSSGASSRSGTPPTASRTSTTPSQTFSRSDVMMTDANGVQYDYNGNAIRSAPTTQRSSSAASVSGFGNFRSGSGPNLDKNIQNAAQVSNTVKAAANSPAVKADLASGGIKSLSVGPMGTRVSVGSGAKTATKPSGFSGPSSFSAPPAKISSQSMPSAKIGMSAPRGFYDGITTEQENALRGIQRQAERESLGLLGRSTSDPRSTVSTPANRAPSAEQRMGIAEALKRAGVTAFNAVSHPMQTAGGALAGTLSGAADQMKNTMQSIAAATDPRYANLPGVQEQAIKNSFDTALNYGILGLGTSAAAGGVPKDAVGAFVYPGASPTAEMTSALRKAREMWEGFKGQKLTPEQYAAIDRDVFDTTKKMLSQDVSGVQTLRGNFGVEIAEPYDLRVSGLNAPAKYKDVFKQGPLTHYVPSVNELNIISDKNALKSGNLGYYNSAGVTDPYTGLSGVIREYTDMLRGKSGKINGPGVSINSFDPKVLGQFEEGLTPQKMAAHEIGGHYMNDISGGLYKDQQPVGPETYADALKSINPSMSDKLARQIAESLYRDHLEEQAARKLEGRVGLPGSFIRDYENRFSNFTKEELEGAERSRKNRDRFGVTQELRARYGI